MQHVKKHWYKLPDTIRRVLVFIVGAALIITAGLIGPIPGPGGSIVFLLGIAVLASEFTWAERLRDQIFAWYKKSIELIKANPRTSIVAGSAFLLLGYLAVYFFYKYFI